MPTENRDRDVIYAELDDEVTTLFDRVKRSRKVAILIVIPTGAEMLRSLVNLKILRYKSEGNGKAVTIVTKDVTGRRLALEAGLSVAEKVEIDGKDVMMEAFQPAVREKIADTLISQKKSLTRRILDIATGEPTPMVIDRDEIPFAAPRKELTGFWSRFFGGVSEVVSEDEGGQHYVVRPPSRIILGLLIAAAATLVFFIVYIAVPTATIYVSPRADPLDKVVSITLAGSAGVAAAGSSAHIVPAEFFDLTITKDIRIGTTGEIFEGTSSKGHVTLFNKTNKDKFLVPSRLLAVRDQIVYHTMRTVTIPAATPSGGPGKIDVDVVACEKDDTHCDCINRKEMCKGSFVGARGNIAPAFFSFPAIPDLSPSRYYAESSAAFTSGVTKVTKFVADDDVKEASATVAHELPAIARAELATLIAQKNQTDGRGLVLLPDAKSITTDVLALTVPPRLTGSLQSEFIVQAKVRIRGVAYEQNVLHEILLHELETKVHPEKRLTKIHFDHLAIRTEELNLAARRVKLAVTIEGIEEFNFDELTASGTRLVEKMRSHVLGRPVAEAEAYIRNLPEINNVAISSWPLWARTVPELPENVSFKLKR